MTPTREAALAQLQAFIPRAGRAYAANRNVDHGPQDRSNVSALSPYIRRRMITEEEVVRSVLSAHSFAAAEKYIQEIAWRTYWKGWLEMRPNMLRRYNAELAAQRHEMQTNSGLAKVVERAQSGATGIECFDAWAQELTEYGWLHNHSRMWFASIWIFTLGLPWQLGADFFYRYLIDADPASNTLSWRWVAGLHTRGKHYLARAENIERNTQGRFAPYGDLNETAGPLPEDAPPPDIVPLPAGQRPSGGKLALLITEEDLHPESWHIDGDIAGIAVLPSVHPSPQDSVARRFAEGAITDAVQRAGQHFGVGADMVNIADLPSWTAGLGVGELVTAYAPAGDVAIQMQQLEPALTEKDIAFIRLQREWDTALWPHAKAGFFKLKTKLAPHVASFIL
ncbi:FAD-binding domain-containing protein [Sphingorhabdus arenilitoris]|uniref:FAD-binding domain-containing protein n=1 Tax=Sphingorhabdus arenilitoris TaxID=1490041 RepID=A0ABV8RDZ4_9SPHN